METNLQITEQVTITRRRASTLGLVLVLASLTACGGGGGDDQSPQSSSSSTASPSRSTAPNPTTTPNGAGLDRRPINTSCVAPPRPAGALVGSVEPVFPGLSFRHPVALLQAPDTRARWFVVEKAGRVLAFPNDPTVREADVFVDIRKRVDAGYSESGLLGMAFHPEFAINGEVFLSYTRSGNPLVSVLSRFTSKDGGRTVDPDSEQEILTLDQPTEYHKGGGVAFGPDGYLYIGFGNGGIADTSQNEGDWFGALLRIDVDAGAPYAVYGIPHDNPFADGGGRPEIYARGFRNPWRWSFDRLTRELWLGDVGEGEWEEIDRVDLGGNYGWPIFEGSHCQRVGCSRNDLTLPVATYRHSEGCSVIGGYVYRGSRNPALAGRYVYGDLCSGYIWALDPEDDAPPQLLLDSDIRITSFAEDHDGEIYVVDLRGGLYRLSAERDSQPGSFPTRLSDTGCVDRADPTRPSAGMIPYDVNVPLWSDGAEKDRWLALPDGATITIAPDGDWDLPVGSVLTKAFRQDGRMIETRLLVRHADGRWAGYSYAWDEAQLDAVWVPVHTESALASGTWVYPSGGECLACHTEAVGRTIGLTTDQLNRDLRYPSTGRTANQLTTLDGIGLFAPALGRRPDGLPALPAPDDDRVGLEAHVRAYLHANCSHCHRPGGLAFVDMDLRSSVSFDAMKVCNVASQTNIGIPDLVRVAPGDLDRSMLFMRISDRTSIAMPPLATTRVDERATALVREWIESLRGCSSESAHAESAFDPYPGSLSLDAVP